MNLESQKVEFWCQAYVAVLRSGFGSADALRGADQAADDFESRFIGKHRSSEEIREKIWKHLQQSQQK